MADISKDVLRKEIAAILKGANLADTSAKNVRLELEEKLGCKLQARKKEIEELVVDYISSKGKKKAKKPSDDEEDEEDEEEEADEDEDESEEEEKKKPAKRASTGKKPAPKKKKAGSDDSEASDSESDSDEDWGKSKKSPAKKSGGGGGGAAKASGGGKGKGGYTRSLMLSPELAALVGQESMARHEVVKKIWSIIKERDLYDPKNKQYAICDDALLKVIGVKRFRTFGMMKYLKNHFIG